MNKLSTSVLAAAALASQACESGSPQQPRHPAQCPLPPHAVRICEKIGDQVACVQGIGQFSPDSSLAKAQGWEDVPVDASVPVGDAGVAIPSEAEQPSNAADACMRRADQSTVALAGAMVEMGQHYPAIESATAEVRAAYEKRCMDLSSAK